MVHKLEDGESRRFVPMTDVSFNEVVETASFLTRDRSRSESSS